MYQSFSKPDWYFARCGDLRCSVTERRISAVPAFLRGVRALFVSDVHALPSTTDAQMAVLEERMASLRADIILLGGDYSDEAAPTRRLLRRLAGLSAPLGMFAVVGNNDREAFPDVDELRKLMADAGFTLLVNQSQTFRVNGGRLILAGLDEYSHGRPRAEGLYPAESAPDAFRLLLSHYPRAVSPVPDLMLSGHTHGGQFNLLGVTPYTVGFERLLRRDLAPDFIAGLHDCRGGRVMVSKGIGASRIPLRVGVKPEINLIRFD